jgi:Tfp pilus assembly protein PilF
MGQPLAALALFEQALALDPTLASAYSNRGVVLRELRELEAALASYDRAIGIDPTLASAHANRADVLIALQRHAEGLVSCERAIALDARRADAHLNRGCALRALGRPEEALAAFERVIALRPDFAAGYSNRGAVLADVCRWQEALASYDRAIALQPDFAEARFNRAVIRLQLGDFAAWAEYEWRWRNENGKTSKERRPFKRPLWRGEGAIAGRRILLHAEQGLGDTLQFCRYVSHVTALGAQVTLEVQPPLVALLALLPGVSQVIARGSPLPAFDWHCPLLSLPLAFGTRPETIPGAHGYLRCDKEELEHWRSRLGDSRRPRIGLAWSGNPTNAGDGSRNVALAELIRYLPAGFQYFCLQTQVRAADQATLDAHPEIVNFADELSFKATAALCELMDAVISVDTSIAHLSGALGRPTRILLAASSDWRWLLDCDTSPWYAAARLYRQTQPGDWGGVLERLARDLRREFHQPETHLT